MEKLKFQPSSFIDSDYVKEFEKRLPELNESLKEYITALSNAHNVYIGGV